MSAAAQLQQAVYDLLVADTGVAALIGDRIYDGRPAGQNMPCATFGPATSATDDEECIDGEEIVLQVDVWTEDGGRGGPCRDIMGAIRRALHDGTADLADPYALASLRVESMRDFADPDGITWHGIVNVTGLIETG